MTPPQAIVGATALVGTDLTLVEDAVVLVEEGVVSRVGSRVEVDVPDEISIYDATGTTLLPGFIDAHVHIGFYEPADVLAGGVTTIRDLAWPPHLIGELVRRSASSGFPGPTIIAAGPMLTAPGGYPTRAGWAPPGTGLEVSGADQAADAVATVADGGFSIVKVALNPPVGPVLDLETLAAIVAAAHDRGLRVTGHIYGLHELEKAIDAGVDELAHMLMSQEDIPATTLGRMVERDMTIVPTLSVFSGDGLRVAIANLYAWRKVGGRVVYGTDLGNAGPLPGIDAREVRSMTQSGMTGLEIIRSATVDSAAWLGLESTGSITPGKDADLVLVRGEPLDDPMDLTRVRRVWRRGIPTE